MVLLHGFGRSGLSLWQLEHFLKQAGYDVINVNYPSTILPIDQLVEDYLPRRLAKRLATGGGRVHFVTHSMGGVLLRGYLQRHPPVNLGRVVMLAPPNQGSEAADFWSRSRGLRLFAGPNLARLGTNPESGPRAFGRVQFDLGVIPAQNLCRFSRSCCRRNRTMARSRLLPRKFRE
ncbi:MAG: alpha/beta fold hydrolase [Pedosphaera sp.]|nr:alpha/beta fold hydrolase [Pedosphaera sp.]